MDLAVSVLGIDVFLRKSSFQHRYIIPTAVVPRAAPPHTATSPAAPPRATPPLVAPPRDVLSRAA